MKSAEKISGVLKNFRLSTTPCRRSVLSAFIENPYALSHHDVELLLNYEFDRVTIYRTFHTFEEKGVIHKVIDNEGVARYALCSEKCSAHHHHDSHLHFTCIRCSHTICLENSTVPEIKLPSGFVLNRLNVLGEGICKSCSEKK
jgi:Fur family transcriptional regulator, ferric uptake regulator